MVQKQNIIVLFGGNSSERKISILSGKEILKGLNRLKYNPFPVEILKDGITWRYKNKDTSDYYKFIRHLKIDLVFIALHGPNGEDGKVQGLLDIFKVKYTGSGAQASAIAIDKEKTKNILKSTRINTPFGIKLKKDEDLQLPDLKFPLFVKPNSQGSSVGSAIVKNRTDLKFAINKAFNFDSEIIVEEYIKGVEITVPILGNRKPTALPVIEIRSKNEFFDFNSKYNSELADEICPANISKKLTEEAKKQAIKAFKVLGCRDFARVDMIIKNNKIYILEVNTIPGLTSVSLFPKSAKVFGLSYENLLDKIIHYANVREN